MQVPCPGYLASAVAHCDEVSEAELPADVFRQLVGKGFGTLHYEAGPEALRYRAHTLLGTLHKDGHTGSLLPDEPAQVHAGIQLFGGGRISAVQHEADVGNHAQKVVLVGLVHLDGVVQVGCKEYLGTGPLAEYLLVLVEGVAGGVHVLLEHQFVKQGKIGGVVAHAVFHQQYALYARAQDVVGGVQAVLQQFDYGYYEVRTAAPVEDIVQAGVVFALHLPVNLL